MLKKLSKLINLRKSILVLSIILSFNLLVSAAPGDLDNAFGNGGKTTLDFNQVNDYGNKIAVQADGKIIVGGYTESGATVPDFSLARYNTDGTLDISFGDNGKVVTLMASFQMGFGIAVQTDGKIIAVGNGLGGAPFATVEVHRYNTDGSLDSSFGGGDGIVTNAIGNGSKFTDVAIQTDGKIVAVGDVSFGANFTFLAARYNSDGTLDTSFNDDGIYSSPFLGSVDFRATAVAIQADGKIVIGGENNFGGVWTRLNTNGTPDGSSSLASAGISIKDIALQADGKIIFAGTYMNSNEPYYHIGINRLNNNGSRDQTFGINSANFVNIGAESFGTSVVIQSDGRIVVGGYVNSSTRDFALARFNSNGFLDVGFGNSGKITTQIGSGDDQLNGLALQADGKILAVGTSFNGSNNDFAVARYLGSDSSTLANNTPFDFDGDGKSDTAVFRSGNWYILQSFDNSFRAVSFGQTGDVIVPADYDGDGRTDTAVFRPSTAYWYILRSSDHGLVSLQFGTIDSLPRPGDFDGDGKADIAVFYPAGGNWYIKQSQSGNTRIVNFGTTGDVPVIANFDGDNKDDIAVFRASTGNWYWLQSSDNGFRAAQFGASGDLATPADYDGDGKSDLAVFRPSTGSWYEQRSAQGFSAVNFGINSDRPVAADYDGDGKADVGVFRNGNWYELRSSNNGFAAISWGQSGDSAIPAAFVP